MDDVTTEAELRQLPGHPLPRVASKDRPRLPALDRSAMCRLAVANVAEVLAGRPPLTPV